ncbi:MAG TPA: SDR family NAD(P)-dependent oxidoreductase [Gemmatimonadales bacterium]|nr:SDR family NAD(P)-dependent oxidoreductase [Gemmatimonadales bacterium]
MTAATGRVAVVTGAGRGIGAATSRALADAGLDLVLAARTREQIERQAADLASRGIRARAVVCDVTSEPSVEALSREAAELGPVSVLVNNAGAAGSMPLVRTSLEQWNRLLAVNATGAFLCTRAFLPGMLERKWGRVVNVASTAGLEGGKYLAAYSAAKHALVGLTRSVAAEVADTGITANAVCPGFVDTDMTVESVNRIAAKTGRTREEALAAALASAGQSRLITADEVAAAVVAVALGAEAAPPNGLALVLDGREPMDGRFTIVNPEALGAPRGWNNGMLARGAGRTLFVAGQTARDASGRVPPVDFVTQFDRALANVLAVLGDAGGEPRDIGRFTIYVTEMAQYRGSLKPLGEVYRKRMGTHYPAMALVEVKSLVDPNAVVEIEATAVLSP